MRLQASGRSVRSALPGLCLALCVAGRNLLAYCIHHTLACLGTQTDEIWVRPLVRFDRALAIADTDEVRAEIWYNIGHIGIGIGDLGLAY